MGVLRRHVRRPSEAERPRGAVIKPFSDSESDSESESEKIHALQGTQRRRLGEGESRDRTNEGRSASAIGRRSVGIVGAETPDVPLRIGVIVLRGDGRNFRVVRQFDESGPVALYGVGEGEVWVGTGSKMFRIGDGGSRHESVEQQRARGVRQ